MVARRSKARGVLARLAAVAALMAVAAGAGLACGNDATGVTACKQIEEARCRRAPGCGIGLEPPYSTSGTSVDACIRFYDVACLHGLEASDPGPVAVGECVTAIEKANCSVVVAPQTSSACAWLVPSPSSSTSDASDAPATVAESDAGTDSPD